MFPTDQDVRQAAERAVEACIVQLSGIATATYSHVVDVFPGNYMRLASVHTQVSGVEEYNAIVQLTHFEDDWILTEVTLKQAHGPYLAGSFVVSYDEHGNPTVELQQEPDSE